MSADVRHRPQGWTRSTFAALGGLLLLAGCGGSSVLPNHPTVSAQGAPGDASPEQTLRRLEWSWNQRDASAYRVLFTEDYRFVFSALDPYGNPYRSTPWTREDELLFADHFFRGGHSVPPGLTLVSLTLDRNFVIRPDPRAGKNTIWHRVIRTSLNLAVMDSLQNQISITGFAEFFFVRGDAALVPPDLIPFGFTADSTHWYIDRWEDDTTSEAGAQSMPATRVTLGTLKALYR